jgi:1,3-beta-glucanosyltransferase GAS3
MAQQILVLFLTAFAFFTTLTLAVTPLKVQGSEFVNSVSGDRFQIIGVAYVSIRPISPVERGASVYPWSQASLITLRSYQPGGSSGFNPGSDPLSDPPSCLRDATLMQKLGVGVQTNGIASSAHRRLDQYYPHLQP